MKKGLITGWLWLWCFFVLPATASVDVNRLIKEQKNNDSALQHENQRPKKDVFSAVGTQDSAQLIFPQESPCFPVDKLIINDAFIHPAPLDNIRAAAAGHCFGKQGIARLVQAVQDIFINQGFITTRVVLPEQNLASHRLQLTVIAGKIEKIVLAKRDISLSILPFKAGEILNIRDIEQGLENLQRVPGSTVKIAIEPGTLEGYSNVVIYHQRTQRGNLRASINNWGDKSTGRQLASAAGYLYNPAHINDFFYLAASRSTGGKYNSLSSYYAFPYSYWEYEIFYSQSVSHQFINTQGSKLDYSGRSRYFSARAARMLWRDRNKKVSAAVALIKRKADYQLNDIRLKAQKRDLTNVRAAINYKQNMPGAMLDATLAYQRFLTWPGGSLTADMKSGEASVSSQRINLDMEYNKRLQISALPGYYTVKLGAQYAPAALILQDQFTLGSRWSVRGFENSGGIDGDSGFYLQNTLTMLTNLKAMEYYLGLDYGEISNASLARHARLLGAVTGIKGQAYGLGYHFSLSTPLFYPTTLNSDNYVINFNLSWQI